MSLEIDCPLFLSEIISEFLYKESRHIESLKIYLEFKCRNTTLIELTFDQLEHLNYHQ